MSETTDKPLGVEEVRALLVRAVEEKGADYVYDPHRDGDGECIYFTDEGRPSCIAGHAFAYLGLGPEDVVEGRLAPGATRLCFTPAASRGLLDAQCEQDDGKTWGEALEAFDRAVEALA